MHTANASKSARSIVCRVGGWGVNLDTYVWMEWREGAVVYVRCILCVLRFYI